MAKQKKVAGRQEHSGTSFFSSLSPTKQDLFCIGFLYLITLVLFRGIVFDNAAFVDGGDTANSLSYAHAGEQIKESEGEDVLWMPYFFSGMPTFGNVAYLPHNVNYLGTAIVKVLNLLYLNATWGWIIAHYLMGGIFMFFLMRTWKFSHLVSLLAAITFMLSPNAIGLGQEGHGSKLMALTYLPAVFLLTHLLFEKRNLLSFGLLSAAIGTLLLTNHMQIVYYVFIVVGMYLLYNIAADITADKVVALKKTGLFAAALVLGLCISSYVYLSVYEYSTFSIRGGGTAGSTGGLNYDYATNWSWNPWETIIFLIPSFFGFSSSYPLTWQFSPQPAPLYWGSMPFHTSTEYIGIVPILLGVLAVVYRRNRTTMFFMILTVLVFLMSFGKHFSVFYNLLFTYLPFFNKFRAPSMILHLVPFTVGVLAAYGLSFLLDVPSGVIEKLKKTLLAVAGTLVAGMIIGFLFKSSIYQTLSGSWFEREGENYGEATKQVIAALKPLRFDVLWKDYIKFVFIFGASALAIVAFLNKKIKGHMLGIALIAILIVDLAIIDVKFINPKPAQRLEQNFQPDATIAYLKQQPGLFRVFPVGDLFMDNTFAYHGITSIGGYNPAKLKIYQTMLDSCMYNSPDPTFPLNMNVVNMLNVRYLVLEGQLPEGRFQRAYADESRRRFTYLNPSALPRAFFVKSATVAPTQTAVFSTLNSSQFNATTMAVVEKPLPQQISTPDSATADVTEYKSRTVSIRAYTSSPALLVLSEVYYPAGWKAYIDGNETEIFKTNYILRSVVVPAGSHKVTFRFDPPMYTMGWNLTRVSWIIAVVCILIGLWKIPSIRVRLKGGRPEQAVLANG